MTFQDSIPVVVLALVEVALFEALIRLGFLGIERAAGALFILILLNFGFVAALRSEASRGREKGR